jgi:putative ABC transport system permease protein
VYFSYLVKELTRKRGRTATNVLVVAVLVAVFVVLTSVMNAYTEVVYLPFKDTGADMIVQKSGAQISDAPTSSIRLPFGKGVFYQDEIDKITTLSHIQGVSRALILWRFDKGKFISIEGIEADSFTGKKYGSWVMSGRFFQQGEGRKVVVEKHFAKFYGLKLGDSMTIGNSAYEIVGVLGVQGESQISSTNLYINLADAQTLIDIKGYSQLYVSLDGISSEDVVRSDITKIDKDAIIVSGSSIAASIGNVIKIYEKFQFLVLAIIAVIIGLILFQVNATSLIERRRDIGVLQAVGWTKANISKQIVSEIFAQSIVGFALGILVSFVTLVAIGSISVKAVSQGLDNTLSTLSASVEISGIAIIQFFVLILAISVLVSLFLSRKLAGMKPMLNLQKS